MFIKSDNKKAYWNRKKPTYFFILFCVVVLFFLIIIFPNLLPNIFTAIFSPFYRINFGIEEGGLQSRQSLINENARLRIQIDQFNARLDTSAILSLEKENEELRKMIMGTTTRKTNKVLVSVISHPPFIENDILILDITDNINIKTGDPVYANNIRIGEISSVVLNNAKVTLYTSSGQKRDVFIGNENINATALGRGGGQSEIELPKGAHINEGDIVKTSKIDNNLFGTIKAIESDPASPFIKAIMALPVNIYELRWVSVEIL